MPVGQTVLATDPDANLCMISRLSLRVTSEMESGLANHIWSLLELIY